MSVNTMKDGSYCVCLLVSKLGKALTGIGTKGDRIISSLRILGTNVVSIAGLFLTTYTMKEEKNLLNTTYKHLNVVLCIRALVEQSGPIDTAYQLIVNPKMIGNFYSS